MCHSLRSFRLDPTNFVTIISVGLGCSECSFKLLRSVTWLSHDNQIKQVFFIFNARKLLSEHRRLSILNLSGTYQRERCTRPTSCAAPQQLFHMVNSVTCMNTVTSLEKAIKRVLNKL